MPTASLPIEPASHGSEFNDENQSSERPLRGYTYSPVAKANPELQGKDQEVALEGGLQLNSGGFGAQLRLLEYTLPWLALTQTLRYFGHEESEQALFERQYGLMLGLQLHPWRSARVSPLLHLQAGGDRYERALGLPALDLLGMEAVAGVELQLARAASLLLQWAETYYPQLKEPLYAGQAPDKKLGSMQVVFNLRWSSSF